LKTARQVILGAAPSQSLLSVYIGTTAEVAWFPRSIDRQAAKRSCSMLGDQLYGVLCIVLFCVMIWPRATD
jgi:hypothetical protein